MPNLTISDQEMSVIKAALEMYISFSIENKEQELCEEIILAINNYWKGE